MRELLNVDRDIRREPSFFLSEKHCTFCDSTKIAGHLRLKAAIRRKTDMIYHITANVCQSHVVEAEMMREKEMDMWDIILALLPSEERPTEMPNDLKCAVCEEPCVAAHVKACDGRDVLLCWLDFSRFCTLHFIDQSYRPTPSIWLVDIPKETYGRKKMIGFHCYACGNIGRMRKYEFDVNDCYVTVYVCMQHASEINGNNNATRTIFENLPKQPTEGKPDAVSTEEIARRTALLHDYNELKEKVAQLELEDSMNQHSL